MKLFLRLSYPLKQNLKTIWLLNLPAFKLLLLVFLSSPLVIKKLCARPQG